MPNEINHPSDALSASFKGNWVASVVSWFARLRKNHNEKQEIKKLLSASQHLLEDVGILRADLGIDLSEIPSMHAGSIFPNPYILPFSIVNSNHAKRRG